MEKPFAFTLSKNKPQIAYRVRLDAAQGQRLPVSGKKSPAIVVTRKAVILSDVSAGIFDAGDVIAVHEGSWEEAILVVVDDEQSLDRENKATFEEIRGDAEFLAEVERDAPELSELAKATMAALRAAGIDGALEKSRLGRWVNHPLNTFTLKAQPRAGNLHFTLYGNPESYEADGFLRKDQNSYSRGWIRTERDLKLFVDLARQSHARRSG